MPISEVDFKNTSDILKEEYLDRYEGVKPEILSTNRFNEKFRFKYDLLR